MFSLIYIYVDKALNRIINWKSVNDILTSHSVADVWPKKHEILSDNKLPSLIFWYQRLLEHWFCRYFYLFSSALECKLVKPLDR